MRTLRFVAVVSLAAPAIASAESSSQAPQSSAVPDVQGWMISEGAGPARVRQVLPGDAVTEPYAAGEAHILYLNKNGTTLSPAQVNDSRANRSTLVTQTTAVPAWAASAATWATIMSCSRTMWAPYNVTITDVDP